MRETLRETLFSKQGGNKFLRVIPIGGIVRGVYKLNFGKNVIYLV